MENKRPTFKEICEKLTNLGYVSKLVNFGQSIPTGKPVIFSKPKGKSIIILPRMKPNQKVSSLNLRRIRSALAQDKVIPDRETAMLLEDRPIRLWHSIIDAEAEYLEKHGRPPRRLKLPVSQAYDLAKLRRDDFGALSGRVMSEGIKVFEREGLLGIPVQLVRGEDEFAFE